MSGTAAIPRRWARRAAYCGLHCAAAGMKVWSGFPASRSDFRVPTLRIQRCPAPDVAGSAARVPEGLRRPGERRRPTAAERRADDHALFERFAHTRSPAARTALVERFLPLGHYRARRYRSAEDARDAPDGRRLRAISLDQAQHEDDEAGTLGDGIAIDGFVGAEDAVLLEDLMRVLPERERIVVVLRFRDDLLHTEIAERVGVSQMQVSRILRSGIASLQDAAESDAPQLGS